MVGGLAGAARGEDAAGTAYRINAMTEAKIQEHVLDPLLGAGKAHAFLEMTIEVKSSAEKASKGGIGELHRTSSKVEEEKVIVIKEEGKKDGKDKAKEQTSVQMQTASDEKRTTEESEVLKFTAGGMKARILHDADLPKEKLKAVKEALVELYPGKIKAEDVVFVPAAFTPPAAKAEKK